jgi:hypothetical protein
MGSVSKRVVCALVLLGLLLAVPAGAQASGHHVKKPCRSGYVRRRVRVRRHRHGRVRWVHVSRCVKVSYRARIDPSFTQSATDPMAVTYAYAADATETVGGKITDLAQIGQLPAGVLNLFSATSPGGPASLFCSINVGGAALGGSCPITYAGPGTYAVTTQYIPNAASAVTGTDQETVSQFTTTTTLSVVQTGCGSGSPPGYTVSGPYCEYTVSNSVSDQNGNVVAGQVGLDAAPQGGSPEGSMVPANGSCTVYVTRSWVLSPDCNFESGSGVDDTGSWTLTASFGGSVGWGSSLSAPQTVAP